MSIGTNGKHIIIDLWKANKKKLNNKEFIKRTLLEAARKANSTIMAHKFHKFIPSGVSGYVLIAESHISIHTWPDEQYASLDVYTCGDKTFPDNARDYVIEAFGAQDFSTVSIDRGRAGTTLVINENKICDN